MFLWNCKLYNCASSLHILSKLHDIDLCVPAFQTFPPAMLLWNWGFCTWSTSLWWQHRWTRPRWLLGKTSKSQQPEISRSCWQSSNNHCWLYKPTQRGRTTKASQGFPLCGLRGRELFKRLFLCPCALWSPPYQTRLFVYKTRNFSCSITPISSSEVQKPDHVFCWKR